MAFNGSGVFQRVRNWVADAAAGIKIRADYHDAEDDGFAAGLTNCITKDGQTVITQNIPFNSKRITGLADPINPQDAATKASVATQVTTVAVPLTGGTITGNLVITGTLGAGATTTGILTINGTSNADSLIIKDTSGTKFLVFKPETALNTADILYWTGASAGTLNIGGTLAASVLNVSGAITGATTLAVGGIKVYGNIPVNPQSNYWTVPDDASKCIAGTGTIVINSGHPYPVGTVITFVGYGGVMTVTISGAALYWVSPSGLTSGARNLPDRGVATALKTPDGNWVIGGNGLT